MSIKDNININIEINTNNKSLNEEFNPIINQLIEFGYDKNYSKRVFHYFHPDDLEEALNYMAIDNGIIQHRFVKDKRNLNNKLCFICNENEEIHLKELNFINSNNSINTFNFINNNENNYYSKDRIESIESIKENINNSNSNKILNINTKKNNLTNLQENEDNKVSEIIIKNKNENNLNIGIHSIKKINEDINGTTKNLKKLSFKMGVSNPNKETIPNKISENEKSSPSELSDSSVFYKSRNKSKFDSINNSSSERIFFTKNIKNNMESKNKIVTYNIKKYIINSKNYNDSEKDVEEEKKECPICGEEFIVNGKNKVKKCGHAFCDGCWYDFLSIKIKENKLPSIKCLDYNCDSKLSDEFIINLLNSDTNLIKKYKKYKIELEVINDPNKKLCPFPNCDSFLELKELQHKYIKCKNNHTFCFLCLKEPHGNLPCNEKMDESMVEFAKNNFVKKCPNCGVVIEKKDGCNHITCAKCQYQWCWLCNEKYESDHFDTGKCKGFQFFKQKNEYEIKLMMEGKINSNELSPSQRQSEGEDRVDRLVIQLRNLRFELDNDSNDFDINSNFQESFNNSQNISVQSEINFYELYLNESLFKKIFIIFHFIFFGNILIIKRNLFRSPIICIILNIPLFFPLIYINIISLLLILIFSGFKELIEIILNKNHPYIKRVILICSYFLLGTFCKFYQLYHDIVSGIYLLNKSTAKFFLFFPCFIIQVVIVFPQIVFCNFINMLLLLIKKGSFNLFLSELDFKFEMTFGFSVLKLDHI